MADARIAGTLRPYASLVAAQVRSQASYRTSFVIDLVGNGLVLVGDLTVVFVLFRIAPALGGFAITEVLLMFGLASVAFSLADLAVGSIERIRHYVRTGLLDAVLVRPLGALAQLVALDFAPRRAGRVVSSAVLLVAATWLARIEWTPGRAVLLMVAPVAGAVFFAAVFVASATVAFWWIESGELANSVTYGGRDFTSYPITIYSGWFRRLFAYGLGFGFVAYYPALALLGRADPLGLPAWLGWTCPLVAVVAATAAAAVWRLGVRHYRSTGS
ncbi:MAG TPA: ABC-2 family transporter protein [Pilimelia sp.]|nr:ABC-2 family transporter protein [Pilimelia sp.]